MALKSVLTTLDGLSDDVKKEYTEKDGKFYLDIEGLDEHPGVGALKRAKDHEKALRQTAETKLQAAEDKVVAKDTEIEGLRTGAIPKSDVDALKLSYESKLTAAATKADEKYNNLRALVEKEMLDGQARVLATEISTAPDLLVPHIRSRLALEEVDGTLSISVLGTDGKPSANSVEDLRKELLSNKAYAPILIGSKASGGGAAGGSGRGGASSKKFGDMTERERTEFYRDDPEGFRKANEEHKKSSQV